MWCAFAACQLLVTPYEFQNSGYHSEPELRMTALAGVDGELAANQPRSISRTRPATDVTFNFFIAVLRYFSMVLVLMPS